MAQCRLYPETCAHDCGTDVCYRMRKGDWPSSWPTKGDNVYFCPECNAAFTDENQLAEHDHRKIEHIVIETAIGPIDDKTNTEFYRAADIEYKDMKDGRRYNYVGAIETEQLNQCCAMLYDAFGESCYQVGSSTYSKQFRDVDIRMIIGDATFDKLFGTCSIRPFQSVLELAISVWMKNTTNLLIDFQFQRQTDCNAKYGRASGEHHVRNAMGIGYRIHKDADQHPIWHEDYKAAQ